MKKKTGNQTQGRVEGCYSANRGAKGIVRDRSWTNKKYNKMSINKVLETTKQRLTALPTRLKRYITGKVYSYCKETVVQDQTHTEL